MTLTSAELDNRFDYHRPLNEQTAYNHHEIREAARRFAEVVLARVADGREQATAITKIEEAMFWANAGISRRP